MTTCRHVGTSAGSKEAPRHVAGRGRFVDDLVLPRMLHASVLRSPYGHARIIAVGTDEATRRRGVRAVIGPADVRRDS
jgi:carbon-monoxide dehydrogenase large subunit